VRESLGMTLLQARSSTDRIIHVLLDLIHEEPVCSSTVNRVRETLDDLAGFWISRGDVEMALLCVELSDVMDGIRMGDVITYVDGQTALLVPPDSIMAALARDMSDR